MRKLEKMKKKTKIIGKNLDRETIYKILRFIENDDRRYNYALVLNKKRELEERFTMTNLINKALFKDGDKGLVLFSPKYKDILSDICENCDNYANCSETFMNRVSCCLEAVCSDSPYWGGKEND